MNWLVNTCLRDQYDVSSKLLCQPENHGKFEKLFVLSSLLSISSCCLFCSAMISESNGMFISILRLKAKAPEVQCHKVPLVAHLQAFIVRAKVLWITWVASWTVFRSSAWVTICNTLPTD